MARLLRSCAAASADSYHYLISAVDAAGNESDTKSPLISTLPVLSGFWTSSTIEIDWTDAEPASDVVGYRVYYGTSSGNYSQSVNVGNTTSTTLTGLANCTDWYAAVKAYNGAGESPEFSNEISGWACPIVNTPSPASGIQGTQFTLNIHGSNFQSGATVEIDNPNVRLDSPAVLSCDQIQVAATIEPTGAPRPFEKHSVAESTWRV